MKTFKILIISSLIFLISPSLVLAEGIVPDCGGNPCTYTDFIGPDGLVDNFINFIVFDLATPVAVVAILFAGLMYVFGATDPGKRSTAKKILWSAVIGLAIALSAYLIVQLLITGLGADEITTVT